jgi:hypothetical protein
MKKCITDKKHLDTLTNLIIYIEDLRIEDVMTCPEAFCDSEKEEKLYSALNLAGWLLRHANRPTIIT